MKGLLFTLSILLCSIGRAAEPASNEIDKNFEQWERRHFTDLARSADVEAQVQGYLFFTHLISSGDSVADVTRKLCPPWNALDTNRFMGGAFRELVPWTNRALVLEWESGSRVSSSGWPLVVFALFSDARKTNLVDALLYDGGQGVSPLVQGPYHRRVLSIKAGDSMDKVFQELGRHQCEYFKDQEGKWRVRAVYRTAERRFIFYEADALTGVILRVWDGTI